MLSGDLAEWGLKPEFDDLLPFVEGLIQLLKLPQNRVVMIPGNHDVNRKACEAYFNNCEADGEKPVAPQLTVVMSTTAQSDVLGYAREAHAASVVPSETTAHETTAIRASSSNDR